MISGSFLASSGDHMWVPPTWCSIALAPTKYIFKYLTISITNETNVFGDKEKINKQIQSFKKEFLHCKRNSLKQSSIESKR